jgi:hypothetical protein
MIPDIVRVGKNPAAVIAKLGTGAVAPSWIQAISCLDASNVNLWGLTDAYGGKKGWSSQVNMCVQFDGAVNPTPLGTTVNGAMFEEYSTCDDCNAEHLYRQAFDCTGGIPVDEWGLSLVYDSTFWGNGEECIMFTGDQSYSPGSIFNEAEWTEYVDCATCIGATNDTIQMLLCDDTPTGIFANQSYAGLFGYYGGAIESCVKFDVVVGTDPNNFDEEAFTAYVDCATCQSDNPDPVPCVNSDAYGPCSGTTTPSGWAMVNTGIELIDCLGPNPGGAYTHLNPSRDTLEANINVNTFSLMFNINDVYSSEVGWSPGNTNHGGAFLISFGGVRQGGIYTDCMGTLGTFSIDPTKGQCYARLWWDASTTEWRFEIFRVWGTVIGATITYAMHVIFRGASKAGCVGTLTFENLLTDANVATNWTESDTITSADWSAGDIPLFNGAIAIGKNGTVTLTKCPL